jgi:hypothetical protein
MQESPLLFEKIKGIPAQVQFFQAIRGQMAAFRQK